MMNRKRDDIEDQIDVVITRVSNITQDHVIFHKPILRQVLNLKKEVEKLEEIVKKRKKK